MIDANIEPNHCYNITRSPSGASIRTRGIRDLRLPNYVGFEKYKAVKFRKRTEKLGVAQFLTKFVDQLDWSISRITQPQPRKKTSKTGQIDHFYSQLSTYFVTSFRYFFLGWVRLGLYNIHRFSGFDAIVGIFFYPTEFDIPLTR